MYSEAFANTLGSLGRYGVRKLPQTAAQKQPSIHKMFRLDRPVPQLLTTLPSTEIEVPLLTDNPRKIQALGLNHAGYEFTRGFKPTLRIFIPQTVYFILAGLLPFKWRLQAKITRTLIHLEDNSFLETEERNSIRVFLTESFDSRFPQLVNVQSHSLDLKTDLVVGSLIDFCDAQDNELTLFTGNDLNTPSFQLQCLLNHTKFAVHAPIISTDPLKIQRPEIISVDLAELREKCNFLFQNTQHNIDNIKALEDGDFIIDGEGPQITDIYPAVRGEAIRTSIPRPLEQGNKEVRMNLEYAAINLIKRGKIKGKKEWDWDECTVRQKDPNAAIIMDEEGFESVHQERWGKELYKDKPPCWEAFDRDRMFQ